MDDVETPETLPLSDAILRWTDTALVEAVRAAERRYIPHQLNEFYRRAGGFRFRILVDSEVSEPGDQGWMGRPSYEWLIAAWNDLERGFRKRLITSIYLAGVQIKRVPQLEKRAIPQAWASAGEIDNSRGTVSMGDIKFAAVTATRNVLKVTEVDVSAAVASNIMPPITEANVRALSDEEVLRLLEDHGRRVVEKDAGPLIQPSRVSFGPILLRRMRWRAESGELCGTLAAECAQLTEWLKTKISHHQIPTAKAAEEPLREAYRLLKAGSRT